jgi:hypothetical protein
VQAAPLGGSAEARAAAWTLERRRTDRRRKLGVGPATAPWAKRDRRDAARPPPPAATSAAPDMQHAADGVDDDQSAGGG